mmetsp:Transcript_98940/g.175288  ORF Transcript_98940/g.175288 Transcript_98940/m.175288 type:complete len:716 (-) Transcript_98940:121-2268(-)
MKYSVGGLVLAALHGLVAEARSVAIAKHASAGHAIPGAVTKVVDLITDLKTSIEADGKEELKTYNTYACWCEETLARKANDIETGKASIESLSAAIKQNKAEVAAHEAEIVNLKKEIVDNFESQKEATELREKERSEFQALKTESESAIGALAAAITVLTGAGTGKPKGSFLGTLQEAQMLGVVAGMKKVLKSTVTSEKLSSQELEVVDQFVRKPEDFVGSRLSGAISATQIAHNPFGDYAPRSTRIFGILSQLKEDFEAELGTATKEEAEKEKQFQEMMATKAKEAATLQKTLEIQQVSSSSKAATLAEDKSMRDTTEEDVAADEAFFTKSKATCKAKAEAWAERTGLRTEELQGIGKAIAILTSDEATKIFEGSISTLFLQVRSEHELDPREKVYAHLRKLATQFRKMGLAKIATEVKSGGHFDKVIAMIDEMMQVLREEEAEDITHRDLCQSKQNANGNEIEDLNHDISKTTDEMARTTSTITELGKQITAVKAEINATKTDLQDLLDNRNTEVSDYKKALADDQAAVKILEQAITFMTQFYANNKLSLGLAQKAGRRADPVYTTDVDTAPEIFSSPYTGRSSEGGGLVSILSMILEDTEKEIAKLKEEDSADQAAYVDTRTSLENDLASQKALLVAKQKAQTALMSKNEASQEFKDGKNTQLLAEQGIESALATDCEWVSKNFDSRRKKRKLEMDGLVEAKAYLSGIDVSP